MGLNPFDPNHVDRAAGIIAKAAEHDDPGVFPRVLNWLGRLNKQLLDNGLLFLDRLMNQNHTLH